MEVLNQSESKKNSNHYPRAVEGVISKEVWDRLPADEQARLLEALTKSAESKQKAKPENPFDVPKLNELQVQSPLEVTDFSAGAQKQVEQGRSMNRKGLPTFNGYQPDEDVVDNLNRFKKGSPKNASTWIAWIVQRWFDAVLQSSR